MIKPEMQKAAALMLRDLENNRLVVTLIPAPQPQHIGHYIRAVENENPGWYRDFCDDFISSRNRMRIKSDTMIKRQNILRALQEIIDGRLKSIDAQRLIPYIEKYINGAKT